MMSWGKNVCYSFLVQQYMMFLLILFLFTITFSTYSYFFLFFPKKIENIKRER